MEVLLWEKLKEESEMGLVHTKALICIGLDIEEKRQVVKEESADVQV